MEISRTVITTVVAAMLVVSMVGMGAAASQPAPTKDDPDDGTSDDFVTTFLDGLIGDLGIVDGGEQQSPDEDESDDSAGDNIHDTIDDRIVTTILEGLSGELDVIDDEIEDSLDDVDVDETDEDEADEIDEDETDESEDDETDEDETDESEDDETDEIDEDDSSAEEPDAEGPDTAEVEQHVHDAVNEERVANGEDELELDTELRDIARDHSDDMAERDELSHEGSDGDGFTDRYDDAGYECSVNGYAGGENIAQTWYDTPVNTDDRGTVHYEDEQDLGYGIVDQWMSSPGHQDNLLGSHWENHGIGVTVTDDNKVFATQNFC